MEDRCEADNCRVDELSGLNVMSVEVGGTHFAFVLKKFQRHLSAKNVTPNTVLLKENH